MPSKLRTSLTYANVVSTLCLFVVLGGSAYAATTITGKNVKNSSLTGTDIKNSSLTTSDVKNRSLLAADFKSGQLPAGPSGAQGPQGATGQTGSAGPVSLQYLEGSSVTLPAGAGSVTGTVPCPDGKSVTGGGATITTVGPDVIMDSSYPSDNASDADTIRDNAWSVAYNNPTASASSFRVYAICTTPSSKS